jgi:hypothetical protein
LNIGGEVDVIGCSRTLRAALASFRRPQIATSAELGPLCRSEGRTVSKSAPRAAVRCGRLQGKPQPIDAIG